MRYRTCLRNIVHVNGVQPICLSTSRQAFLGSTHRRGFSETRGWERRASARGVEALYRARKRLQEKADGEDEVTAALFCSVSPFTPCNVPRTAASRRNDVRLANSRQDRSSPSY